MNLIDRAIEYADPVRAVRRAQARNAMRFFNSGYGEAGASQRKTFQKGWRWRGGSTREDIEANLGTLQQRCRALYMESMVARSAINRKVVCSVGSGLRLRSIPNYEVLGISPEEATAWGRRWEAEFGMWAESKESDQLGLDDFYEGQELLTLSWLVSGDACALLPMGDPIEQPYELRTHLIEADRICNPVGKDNDARFHQGVETDADGRVIAYHIRTPHPLAVGMAAMTPKWTRVPVRGADTGRLNIIFVRTAERPEQYRGVPTLAPVIEACRQLGTYTNAELQAAVVAGLFTTFITSNSPQSPIADAIERASDDQTAADPQATDQLHLEAGAVIALNEGEGISTAQPGRPSTTFPMFLEAVSRNIGACLDVPGELVMLQFGQNYSASRAALLEAWRGFKRLRARIASNYCQPVNIELMTEAVLKGRILAQGFIDDPVMRRAWSRSEWNGPSPGQIQPVQEVQAARMRVDSGFSTFAREAQEIGAANLDEIIAAQQIERQRMVEAGILPETSARDAAAVP